MFVKGQASFFCQADEVDPPVFLDGFPPCIVLFFQPVHGDRGGAGGYPQFLGQALHVHLTELPQYFDGVGLGYR
ncbi:MAG: hypothetical protein A4E55_01846 [Pelotomaculum sp. PtaU1.Bin035]|nr:MAG: hypothetical protein A4E55_01846 [Pelotomaculum sp. PtaU1.Bin035]